PPECAWRAASRPCDSAAADESAGTGDAAADDGRVRERAGCAWRGGAGADGREELSGGRLGSRQPADPLETVGSGEGGEGEGGGGGWRYRECDGVRRALREDTRFRDISRMPTPSFKTHPDTGLLVLRLGLGALLLFHGIYKATHGIAWIAGPLSKHGLPTWLM